MKEKEEEESEIKSRLFEEIMKIIYQKQIKIESIIHRAIEQDSISQEAFNRIHKSLTEHGKKKKWI